jgi:hypothetical protein
MTFSEAIKSLSTWGNRDERHEAIAVVRDAIEDITGEDSEMFDWLYSGDFYGSETVEGLAAEWREYLSRAENL